MFLVVSIMALCFVKVYTALLVVGPCHPTYDTPQTLAMEGIQFILKRHNRLLGTAILYTLDLVVLIFPLKCTTFEAYLTHEFNSWRFAKR